MTKEQLDAIRARLASFSVQVNDVSDLLAEVERLTKLTEETEHQMHMRIRAGYDKTVADAWRAEVKKQSTFAFARGVATMREAVRTYFVDEAKKWQDEGDEEMELRYLRLAGDIRALSDPEDKP